MRRLGPADPGAVPTGAPIGYRDIIGRLPDGRSGFVNDLGAVARVAAVDAYASRQLTDPIIRGLHVCWKNGPAEGWAWLEVRNGLCIFERTRVWQHRFSCGVDPGRLAEDLAVAAIGERLKLLSTAEPELHEKAWLGRCAGGPSATPGRTGKRLRVRPCLVRLIEASAAPAGWSFSAPPAPGSDR